jgi:hypothetical protein
MPPWRWLPAAQLRRKVDFERGNFHGKLMRLKNSSIPRIANLRSIIENKD